ncbi:ABC transporter ATP-binding protein [Polymorphospora sp. NPDC050346]|uniref:ABC transporter ATP-binding protein n=1 Tax=Polymorphospora sp. NPDC050346 TaxID=3155780 RepID=UPI0033FD8647
MTQDRAPLIEVRNLGQRFRAGPTRLFRPTPQVIAVDGVDLSIREGEVVGLVGESGCGKSTLGRTMIRLLEPTSGSITFAGQDITHVRGKRLRALRRDVQFIFQDPSSSLDPRRRIGSLVAEGLEIRGGIPAAQRAEMVAEMLERVGIDPAMARRYPHELSGGQRQRIGIARALILRPRFVVTDEAVSALDLSVQSKILNLLRELKNELNLTYLFISHDLAVVHHVADRIGVMYLGGIVELAPAADLHDRPLHPYTMSLISSIPQGRLAGTDLRRLVRVEGDPPSPVDPPSGCRFHTRCAFAQPERCATEKPVLRQLGPGHSVACHFAQEIADGTVPMRSAPVPAGKGTAAPVAPGGSAPDGLSDKLNVATRHLP